MINQENLTYAADTLRALAHPIRLAIINFIDKKKRVNVNKIYNALKLEQSITSQHLKILRTVGLVETTRDGKFIYYTVNYSKIEGVIKPLDGFFGSKNSL
ncbi:MAG: metalloregulator ArsR/SmtB family transcription factor [Chitinophagales bacterium]|nr:metalloregulator ArsR/SmtB family transcription factor [Chitinophagales bacterium]